MTNDPIGAQAQSVSGIASVQPLDPATVFALANAAWASKDFPAVRAACVSLLTAHVPAPAYVKSYAQLRIAQSYMAEHNPRAAQAEYEQILANKAYPDAHRFEAEACIREIERVAHGLAARDPLASRTQVAQAQPGAEFFVAPDGGDANPGTAERPFATLARARDAIRALKAAAGLPAGGVAVTVKPGQYAVSETFALTAQDSGTQQSPIVYRAETKGTAMFYGGARLEGFTPVTDPAILERLPAESRGKVYQCDLRAQGITDYGELKVRGYGQPPSPPTLELYFNGKPMTLARWPNEGFVGIQKLIEPGVKGSKPSVFAYDSDRHARWTQAEDAWLFGYFRWLWADSTLKIGSIDPVAKTLTTAEAYNYEGGMDTTQGIIYYVFNLLEEIDMPGEWYLDRATGMLYFWSPADPAQARIEIGLLSVPMLTLENAAHVRIEGLAFDLARDNAMLIKDCEDCLIAACTVSRFAGNGITITGGRRCGILGCDIFMLGRRATEVIGGDRQTLTPGEHFVENCQIYDFGRIDRTYTPAIQLEGVGNRVVHNLLYAAPSSVMRIEGNDHLIEYNEIHSAVRESDDQGSIDIFFNPTYRGIIYRYNFFHHNGKTGREGAVHGQAAIRFDDVISGMLVYGNIFWRTSNGNFGAVQINSGRDNVIDNNIFVDCKQGVSGGWFPRNEGWRMILEDRAPADYYRNDLYLTRYPEMAHMMDEPGINNIWRNVFYRCGRVITRSPDLFNLFEDGVFTDSDPGFVNAAAGDFNLKPDAALFEKVGFKPIPAEEIGLYEDAYRATWPVHTTPVELPDWRQG
jgi:hypothetical protein